MTMNRDPLTSSMPTAINVRNATAAVLPAGSLVYISGYHTSSGYVSITAADADAAIGVNVAEMILPMPIGASANGIAYRTCLLDGVIDTTNAAVGDPVYLSTTAGTPTLTVPAAGAVRQIVGRVVTLSTNGRILYHFMGPATVQQAVNARFGYLGFALAAARGITSSDIGVVAVGAGQKGSGYILGSDATTAAQLKRRNAATDPTVDITWAAAVVDEIGWDFPVPLDMDVTVASTFSLRAIMGGATDTPTVAVKCHTGVGGSNLGSATAALAATETLVTATIAASSFTVGQQAIVTLVPGTHGTDNCKLRSFYFTYAKK